MNLYDLVEKMTDDALANPTDANIALAEQGQFAANVLLKLEAENQCLENLRRLKQATVERQSRYRKALETATSTLDRMLSCDN